MLRLRLNQKLITFNLNQNSQTKRATEEPENNNSNNTNNSANTNNVEPNNNPSENHRILQAFLYANQSATTSNEDALQKAIKDMGLRKTFAKGIYYEMHNPNKPAGNYTELRHYYWDETNQKMIELPNVYYVSQDGHEAKDIIDNYNKTNSTNKTNNTNTTPEKTKPTIQNLLDLYGTYRTAMIKFKASPGVAGGDIIEKMNESLQKYIDDNNLDISLDNLKLFFSDVMDKQPSGGAMASAQYLNIRFYDYIENGYIDNRQIYEPQMDEIREALERQEEIQEEIDKINDMANKDIENIFEEETPEKPTEKTKIELYDEIIPHKPELRKYISDIMTNDDDVDPSGINQYTYFTERELDTFVDSIITQIVKKSDNQNLETLLSEIKNAISNALKNDPYAPMNLDKSLMNTDDYLLSDEERKLKADIVDVEFDSDPTEIDGSGFDYSVMPNANDKVADLTSDWDISDIDSALNCKNPYTGEYSKNSSTIKLYKNLEQMKPQLKAYIKEQLNAQGLEYNEQTIEKYLNYYITETVREAIQAKYHDKLPELYPNTVLSANATLQDLGEYLVTKVKDELAEGRTAFGTTWSTSGFDPLLKFTSDYFLTPKEIKQKNAMQYLE